MSGGSWDYFCFRAGDVAERLKAEKAPLRILLGKHLELIAHAMHEIEWVDSGDSSSPVDDEAIRAVFGSQCDEMLIDHMLEEARELIKQLQELGA